MSFTGKTQQQTNQSLMSSRYVCIAASMHCQWGTTNLSQRFGYECRAAARYQGNNEQAVIY